MHSGCHCGAIRYSLEGTPRTRSLCHCSDCRRHAGAPMVAWAMFPSEAVSVVKGTVKIYKSSENGRRHFCPECGTNRFYTNEQILPGITDVQIVTLDDPNTLPPNAHIQSAERIPWMAHVHELPTFDRYPPQF